MRAYVALEDQKGVRIHCKGKQIREDFIPSTSHTYTLQRHAHYTFLY